MSRSSIKALRKLYLTLFLRGRTSRGLRRENTPKSVGTKLALTLVFYALAGLLALGFKTSGTFTLSLSLHSITFVFLGMFVAASAGEILFNKDEAEILMHRPVETRDVLRAKISVLVQVSLYMAAAANLAGLVAGTSANFLFLPAHVLSISMASLLCSATVVLFYQVCLRWFGREKLDNLMTASQIILSICVVAGGQLLPYAMRQAGGAFHLDGSEWWAYLLPPAWFAGLDELLQGHLSLPMAVLAGTAVGMTALMPWLAFERLAKSYGQGVQSLNEVIPAVPRQAGKRSWLAGLMETPPLSWSLRDPVVRAAFRLTAAYMGRDREVKLRLYPGIAPVVIMPLVLMKTLEGTGSSFAIFFAGCYLAMMPPMALSLLQYSPQWQASDLFRSMPISGPAPFIHGARKAVVWMLWVPLMLLISGLVLFLDPDGPQRLKFLLPGFISLPAFSMIPGATGQGIPLSLPAEEAKSAGRGLKMVLAMFAAMALAGLAELARHSGWFGWFLAAEVLGVCLICTAFNAAIKRCEWPAGE